MNDVKPAANAEHINITLTPESMARLTARVRLRERVSIGRDLTARADVLRGQGQIALAEELDIIASDLTNGGQLTLPIAAPAPAPAEDALPQVGLRSDEEDIARMTPSYLRTGGLRD